MSSEFVRTGGRPECRDRARHRAAPRGSADALQEGALGIYLCEVRAAEVDMDDPAGAVVVAHAAEEEIRVGEIALFHDPADHAPGQPVVGGHDVHDPEAVAAGPVLGGQLPAGDEA